MRGRPTSAVFTPVANEATFSLVSDEPMEAFPVNSEGWTKNELEQLFVDTPEDRFLRGEVLYVGAASSNVEYFQYLAFFPDGAVQSQLVVGYQDGSSYIYDDISITEALIFFRADSPGGAVWDQLRIRKTRYGYKKSYRLLQGNRAWNQTSASQARHEAIPSAGEPFKGYSPVNNFGGAPGKMGQAGISLSKKKGSTKKAYFVPANVFGYK